VKQERHVLVIPTKNEEFCNWNTIEAVLSQTILPEQWAIVSDGSTDRADEPVACHARQHRFKLASGERFENSIRISRQSTIIRRTNR
jgi:hypothetical protein